MEVIEKELKSQNIYLEHDGRYGKEWAKPLTSYANHFRNVRNCCLIRYSVNNNGRTNQFVKCNGRTSDNLSNVTDELVTICQLLRTN